MAGDAPPSSGSNEKHMKNVGDLVLKARSENKKKTKKEEIGEEIRRQSNHNGK